MPQNTRVAIIVVTEAERAGANQKLQAFVDGDVFTVGLSPDGKLPFTHYWMSWPVTDSQWNYLITNYGAGTAQRPGQVFDGDTITPDEVLTQLGLQRHTQPVIYT